MGSVQSPALACDQLVASGFCARLALRHSSALFVPCSALCTSAFLPTFPPGGFARRASRGSSPQQDYAGSDSCRPLARSTGLSAYSAPPAKHPDPNHVMSPECRFASHFSASSPTLSGLRLRQRSQARQLTPPKRVRHPTGCSFASSCFPPRLAATQLLSTSCAVTPHGRDSHPADEASSRTHDRQPPAGSSFRRHINSCGRSWGWLGAGVPSWSLDRQQAARPAQPVSRQVRGRYSQMRIGADMPLTGSSPISRMRARLASACTTAAEITQGTP